MAEPSRPLRLGTRASPLAMAQAVLVRDALIAAHGWSAAAVELCPMVASGDKVLDRALAEIGGKALWTTELDAALRAGAIDFAVHSMKDVETLRPSDFKLAAMLPRADVRDRLIGATSIEAIPHGARFGTSAPRRRAQMLRARSDLDIVLLRGNVQTRMGKVASGEVAATLLAAAGLGRLGLDAGCAIPVEIMLPAPSQGAVGMEMLAAHQAVGEWLEAINHMPTYACVSAERALLARLSGDCRSPVAALAVLEGAQIWLRAEIYAADGSDVSSAEARFASDDQVAPGRLADVLLERASPAVRAAFGH